MIVSSKMWGELHELVISLCARVSILEARADEQEGGGFTDAIEAIMGYDYKSQRGVKSDAK